MSNFYDKSTYHQCISGVGRTWSSRQAFCGRETRYLTSLGRPNKKCHKRRGMVVMHIKFVSHVSFLHSFLIMFILFRCYLFHILSSRYSDNSRFLVLLSAPPVITASHGSVFGRDVIMSSQLWQVSLPPIAVHAPKNGLKPFAQLWVRTRHASLERVVWIPTKRASASPLTNRLSFFTSLIVQRQIKVRSAQRFCIICSDLFNMYIKCYQRGTLVN